MSKECWAKTKLEIDRCSNRITSEWDTLMKNNDKVTKNKTRDDHLFTCCYPYDWFDGIVTIVQAKCDHKDADKMTDSFNQFIKSNPSCDDFPYKCKECADFKKVSTLGPIPVIDPTSGTDIADTIKLNMTAVSAVVSTECSKAMQTQNAVCVDQMRLYYNYLISVEDKSNDTLVVIRCCLIWDLVQCMDEVALERCEEKDYKSMHTCLQNNSQSICPEYKN
ncbi:unnamed protein product [Oppiella nova]|uniref:Uncharacterized protein n=1 Tax=Oppiella nova TaxID=334625 RepID=A0A7R9M9Y2_9ACAR|nr:unnamed protein product [Oppiella nova]CAG2173406.1 unnamed protein product [Oppiella nova]